jgi:hypothetical protein
VDETQVWEEGVGHVLVEERGGTDQVEGYSVWTIQIHTSVAIFSLVGLLSMGEGRGEGVARGGRHFHSIQLLFLGYNFVDVWCEEGVCCHKLVANGALD